MPFLSPSACANACPSVIPVSSTVWWASMCRSPLAWISRSIRPWRAIWSSMWSRNGTPVASLLAPVPSRLRLTVIWVSRVLRVTCAVRMASEMKALGDSSRPLSFSAQRFQRANQRVALRIGSYRDAEERSDAGRFLEVAHDDAPFAQARGQFGAVMQGMAGEDEVGTRGQHLEAESFHIAHQPGARPHHLRAHLLEIRVVFHRSQRTGLGEAVERIGVEAVLHPVERLDQVRLADRVADAQAGQRVRFGQGTDDQQLRIACDQPPRRFAAEVDVGLVAPHPRGRIAGE